MAATARAAPSLRHARPMPHHLGKTMGEVSHESGRAYSHIFRSSVLQRPADKTLKEKKPAPGQYHPPNPEWITGDPRMPTSAFSSKVKKSVPPRAVTAEVDYVNNPLLYARTNSLAPGTGSLPWGTQEQRVEAKRDKPFDGFIVPDTGNKMTLGTAMEHSTRVYAATFKSNDNRFRFKDGNPLGPGSYDTNAATIKIIDPKRQSSAFKAQLTTAFGQKATSQPLDNIHTPQLAMMAMAWTSRGMGFSTRERFPRVRPQWGS